MDLEIVSFLLYCFIHLSVQEPEIRFACWGSFGPPVVSAQCPRGTVIQVVRAGLKVKRGVGKCTYRDSDCGCDYGQLGCNMPNVRDLCMGRPACRLDVTQQYINTPACRGFSDYMFIQFNCVSMGRKSVHDICVTDVAMTETGFIRSPNYPLAYPKNRHCMCKLRTLQDHSIKVSILDLNGQNSKQDSAGTQACAHSKLVLDYDDEQLSLCEGQYDEMREYDTGSADISVVMETDNVETSGGFWLQYEAIPEATVQMECFGQFKKDTSLLENNQPQEASRNNVNNIGSLRKNGGPINNTIEDTGNNRVSWDDNRREATNGIQKRLQQAMGRKDDITSSSDHRQQRPDGKTVNMNNNANHKNTDTDHIDSNINKNHTYSSKEMKEESPTVGLDIGRQLINRNSTENQNENHVTVDSSVESLAQSSGTADTPHSKINQNVDSIPINSEHSSENQNRIQELHVQSDTRRPQLSRPNAISPYDHSPRHEERLKLADLAAMEGVDGIMDGDRNAPDGTGLTADGDLNDPEELDKLIQTLLVNMELQDAEEVAPTEVDEQLILHLDRILGLSSNETNPAVDFQGPGTNSEEAPLRNRPGRRGPQPKQDSAEIQIPLKMNGDTRTSVDENVARRRFVDEARLDPSDVFGREFALETVNEVEMGHPDTAQNGPSDGSSPTVQPMIYEHGQVSEVDADDPRESQFSEDADDDDGESTPWWWHYTVDNNEQQEDGGEQFGRPINSQRLLNRDGDRPLSFDETEQIANEIDNDLRSSNFNKYVPENRRPGNSQDRNVEPILWEHRGERTMHGRYQQPDVPDSHNAIEYPPENPNIHSLGANVIPVPHGVEEFQGKLKNSKPQHNLPEIRFRESFGLIKDPWGLSNSAPNRPAENKTNLHYPVKHNFMMHDDINTNIHAPSHRINQFPRSRSRFLLNDRKMHASNNPNTFYHPESDLQSNSHLPSHNYPHVNHIPPKNLVLHDTPADSSQPPGGRGGNDPLNVVNPGLDYIESGRVSNNGIGDPVVVKPKLKFKDRSRFNGRGSGDPALVVHPRLKYIRGRNNHSIESKHQDPDIASSKASSKESNKINSKTTENELSNAGTRLPSIKSAASHNGIAHSRTSAKDNAEGNVTGKNALEDETALSDVVDENSMKSTLIAAGVIGCVLLVVVLGVLIRFAINRSQSSSALRKRHKMCALRARQPHLQRHFHASKNLA